MKRYKMDRWGQLSYGEEPTQEKRPWTVRSVFFALIPLTMILGIIADFLFHS